MKGSINAVNSYNVKVIPSNFILDSERRIVDRDVIGPALDQVIGKLTK
jgi:hypothetical protein